MIFDIVRNWVNSISTPISYCSRTFISNTEKKHFYTLKTLHCRVMEVDFLLGFYYWICPITTVIWYFHFTARDTKEVKWFQVKKYLEL